MRRISFLFFTVSTCLLAVGCGGSSWNIFATSDSDAPGRRQAVDEALAAYETRMQEANARRRPYFDESGDSPTATVATGDSGRVAESETLEILDQYISTDDVLGPIRPKLSELAGSMPPRRYYETAAEMIRASLVEMVATHLIYQRASSELPESFEPRIEKAIDELERERINRDFGGRETNYENHLAQSGESRKAVRDKLRRVVVGESYLREKLVPLIEEPRRSEIENYYVEHKAEFTTEERRELLMIDIPAASFLDRTRPLRRDQDIALAMQKARNAIEEAQRELRAGVPFDQVARKFSKFKQSDGGNWGFVREPLSSRWEVPSRRFFELRAGETSEIIESEGSFFIVRCGRVEGGVTTPFAEAQPKIVRNIKNARFTKLKSDFLQRELAKANIGDIEPFFRHLLRSAPQPRLAGI